MDYSVKMVWAVVEITFCCFYIVGEKQGEYTGAVGGSEGGSSLGGEDRKDIDLIDLGWFDLKLLLLAGNRLENDEFAITDSECWGIDPMVDD